MNDTSRPDTSLPAVKIDPTLARLGTYVTWAAITLVVSLCALFVLSFILGGLRGSTILPTCYGTFGTLAFFSFVFVVAWSARIPLLKRQEQKRQRAAYGDSHLLAEQQPVPDEQCLHLPLTVSLRYQSSVLIRATITFLVAALISTGCFLFPSFFDFPRVMLFIRPLFALIALLFFVHVGYSCVALLAQHNKPIVQLTVTEDEILVGKRHRVAWRNARLFAVDHFSTVTLPLVFEVASADALVRTVWLPRENAQRRALCPLTSYEEYERDMRCVLSIIAQKTGLQLYNLRKA